MRDLLSTKEVAEYLGVHEKRIYGLLSSRGLPGTKVTGKWLFPKQLVDKWLENNVQNRPRAADQPRRLLVVAGSDDPLLSKAASMYRRSAPQNRLRAGTPVYATMGSAAGLESLRDGWCQLAGCHLYDPVSDTYNASAIRLALGDAASAIRFARREQGLAIARGNPKGIRGVEDLARPDVTLANRSAGSGTRTLLDCELRRAGIPADQVPGYDSAFDTHFEVARAVFAGGADVGLCIRSAAEAFRLEFRPVRSEEFQLVAMTSELTREEVSSFIEFLQSSSVREVAGQLGGYEMA